MANIDDLAEIKNGPEAWKQWRQRRQRPDLSRAELPHFDLSGTDLHEADLTWSDLRHADLTGSNLNRALLRDADLRGANLCGADLQEADLRGARLDGAQLAKVRLDGTILAGTGLEGALGLERCLHTGPSLLDIGCVLAGGALPYVFLSGCGLPEAVIAQLPYLQLNPLEQHSYYISCTEEDREFGQQLVLGLQSHGLRCWLAVKAGPHTPRLGCDRPLRPQERLLLAISEHSSASEWIEHEVDGVIVQESEQQRTALFAVRIDDVAMFTTLGWTTQVLSSRPVLDFRRWRDADGFDRAFNALLTELENPGTYSGH